jgi:hypothetical protein
MDGRKETGVSILGMTKYVKGGGGVDLGEVWAQEHMVGVLSFKWKLYADHISRTLCMGRHSLPCEMR